MLLNGKSPHGGDIYANRAVLDFSANIHPLGMPAAVKDALIRAADRADVYPDPHCTALREKLAEAEGVPADGILCGNGAAELIYLYAYALRDRDPRPALVPVPTFCEYELALDAAGIPAARYFLAEADGFRLTEDILACDFTRYSAVFICSPNNPTGFCVDPVLIRVLAGTGVRLFFDFTFLDLTEDPARYRIPALIRDYPNVTVLRAFTKSYAMAGVRLGYALSADPDFLGAMAGKSQCWNVSVPAQEAGIAALGCRTWLRDSVKKIARERERLADSLRACGLRILPGEANYLLLYADRDLPAQLRERGILVRDCAATPGLGKGWFRIAVRTPEENEKLLSAVKEELR